MILNPELRRHLWLEWSLHRMILVGCVLAVVFVFVGLFDPRGFGNVVASAALVMFGLATLVWGSHRAGDSVLDELRERTWDSQRMSALAPWTMTWGKLCGATIMPWFAGCISLGVYFICRQGPTTFDRLQVVGTCIAGALGVQALSLIGALARTRLDKQGKSTLTSWAALGTVALLWVYFSIDSRSGDAVTWYGFTYDRHNFLSVSLLALAAWMTFGAYRLMSTELAVATLPWAWITFVVYLAIYFSGAFVAASWPLTRALAVFAAVGFLSAVGGTYISAFALYRDPLVFRRLKTYAAARRWNRVLEETPIWMASLSLAALFMIGCAASHFAPQYSHERIESVGFSAVVIWLYAVRDLAVLFYFTYAGANKRVESSTIITLALLYWLLPGIIETMGLVTASWLFRPPMWERPLLSVLIIGIHIVIIGGLCYRRYRRRIAPSLTVS